MRPLIKRELKLLHGQAVHTSKGKYVGSIVDARVDGNHVELVVKKPTRKRFEAGMRSTQKDL